MTMSSQRFIRGKWAKGEMNRQIADFCVVFQDEKEPWFLVTSQFEHKCPIPAGVSNNTHDFDLYLTNIWLLMHNSYDFFINSQLKRST